MDEQTIKWIVFAVVVVVFSIWAASDYYKGAAKEWWNENDH